MHSQDKGHLPSWKKWNGAGREDLPAEMSVLNVNRAAGTWKGLLGNERSPCPSQEAPGGWVPAGGWHKAHGWGIEPFFFFFCSFFSFWGRGGLQLPCREVLQPHICAMGFGESPSIGGSWALKRGSKQGWGFLPSCSKRNQTQQHWSCGQGTRRCWGGPHLTLLPALQDPQHQPTALVPGNCVATGSGNAPGHHRAPSPASGWFRTWKCRAGSIWSLPERSQPRGHYREQVSLGYQPENNLENFQETGWKSKGLYPNLHCPRSSEQGSAVAPLSSIPYGVGWKAQGMSIPLGTSSWAPGHDLRPSPVLQVGSQQTRTTPGTAQVPSDLLGTSPACVPQGPSCPHRATVPPPTDPSPHKS